MTSDDARTFVFEAPYFILSKKKKGPPRRRRVKSVHLGQRHSSWHS